MKNTLITLLMTAVAASALDAVWDANPASEQVHHYNLYQSTNGITFFRLASVTNATRYNNLALVKGDNLLYVTAVTVNPNGDGSVFMVESDPSDVLLAKRPGKVTRILGQ